MKGPPTVRLRIAGPVSGQWIYRKMVRKPEGGVEAGSVVKVEDRGGRFVCWAFWNRKSELALRILSRKEGRAPDDAWFEEAVADAVALRRDVLRLDDRTNAWRAVFSEADRLPGLVVDRYADVLSCQVSSLGIYRAFPQIKAALTKALKPKVVHVSADPRIAKIEGFPIPDGAGASARTVVKEHGLSFHVDCARGHKTGFFLDQRDSRATIRSLSRDRRVLDLCSYTGGFALNAAKGGAAQVTGVDLDEDAVRQAVGNAKLNRMERAAHFEHADAFAFLRDLKPNRFDVMVVDPAKQAMKKEDVRKALRYYHDLNALAFAKVTRGGLVLACSCTGLVSESAFLDALSHAADTARRQVQFLSITGAPADHPVPSDFPQARYLKCVLCRISI